MTVRAERIPTTAAAAERQRAILEAALACIEEKGWEAVTIEDVRRASGASIGSIYHHYASKDGIGAALYLEGLARYRAALLDRLTGVAGARELIHAIVLHDLEWAERHPVWTRYLHGMRRAGPVTAIETELRRSTGDFLRTLFEQLAPYVERGEIRALPLALYAPLVLGPTRQVIGHWLSGRIEIDLASVRELLADAAWRAVRGDGPGLTVSGGPDDGGLPSPRDPAASGAPADRAGDARDRSRPQRVASTGEDEARPSAPAAPPSTRRRVRGAPRIDGSETPAPESSTTSKPRTAPSGTRRR